MMRCSICALLVLASVGGTAANARVANPSQLLIPKWETDYAQAMQVAKTDRKMLLVLFGDPADRDSNAVQQRLASPTIRPKLQNYVLCRVPLAAQISVGGKKSRLIDFPSFNELRRGPGIAVVDMVNAKAPYYGHVVSALPLTPGRYFRFRPDQAPLVLDLPAGTLTQRTMIFAVRTHPMRPASASGPANPILLEEAYSHSNYQAQIRNQGHHNWGWRFQRIIGRLTGRGSYGAPVEVVAESWPNQDLCDSAADCVESWRQSSGHWSKVHARHASYGYDIRRGSNGIWYATGIFAN